jgi:thiol:disulfide interchange protein
MPKPGTERPPDVAMIRTLRRLLAVVLLLGMAPLAHAAVDIDDLLPVDEAFVLQARAVSAAEVELAWTIADGYYLYRHRMGADLPGVADAIPLQLPAGRRHVDEFFGEVETYRGAVKGRLGLPPGAGAGPLQLRVKYQGCADAGICYPPQVRTVTVALPPATPAPARNALPLQGMRPGARPGLLAGTGQPAALDALPLPPEQAFGFEAIADGGDRLLLRFTPAPGYYLYRDRTELRLEGAGASLGSPGWPRGVSRCDEHFGDVVVYFDQVDVPVPLRRTGAGPGTVTLRATFQGCQDDGICYPPMTRTVAIAMPASAAPVAPSGGVAAGASPAPAMASPPMPAPAAAANGEDDARAPSPAIAAGTGAAPAGVDAGGGDASGDNAVRSRPPVLPTGGLFTALLLGLLGGLVLNVMPCVLPILSLKVLGLARSGASRADARSHALWYTAGVLVAFAAVGLLVVALRATGQALGWGFQLQQPWFVAALAYLMFAVGLSLSGVFTVGGSLGSLGGSLAGRSGRAGDFFTGVLACVVASPCIAPFMGGALAFAFTASTPVALAVFLALGLGLALPFLVIGFVPALAGRLPKPGPWMETLKQVMAFPMYLTAVALLWVLGRQRGVDAVAVVAAGMVVLALALWWRERARWGGAAPARLAALALLVLALAPVWAVTRLAAPAARMAPATAGDRVPYSAERLQALRDEGRVVFVNMTADWCVTCKANERGTLSGARFRSALREAGATYMVGDWTSVDPAISAFLEQHRAVGVPLYVVYPAGGGEGEVLPALLDDDIVTAALARARG